MFAATAEVLANRNQIPMWTVAGAQLGALDLPTCCPESVQSRLINVPSVSSRGALPTAAGGRLTRHP